MLKRTLFVLISFTMVFVLFSLPIMANNRSSDSSVSSDYIQAPVVSNVNLDETTISRERNSDTTTSEDINVNEVEINNDDMPLEYENVEIRDGVNESVNLTDDINPDEAAINFRNDIDNDVSGSIQINQTEPEKLDSSIPDSNPLNFEDFPTTLEVVEINDGYRLKMSVQNNSGQDILLNQSTIFARHFVYDVQNEQWIYLREKTWDDDPKLFSAGQTFTEEFDLTIQSLSQFTSNPQGEYMFWAVPSVVSNNMYTQLVAVYAKVTFPAKS
jgi:hypothetical protein